MTLNSPSGPPRLPVWGSYWFVLLNNFKFTHIGFHKLAQKYRTKIMGLYLGPFLTVVVNDYQNIKHVLTRPEFQGRVKAPVFDMRTYNKNLGIILTDDVFWEEQRRFALRHMRDFGFGRRSAQLEDIGKEEIQDLLDLLNERRESKDIFSDGLALVPDIFHATFFNAIWFIITGQRFPTKDHDKLLRFTRQALRFQKSVDVTGNALAQTPWIRHLIPYYSGFTDVIQATRNMLKYMEEAVMEHKATYSEDYTRDFIDIFLKEMKRRAETAEHSSFSDRCNVINMYVCLSACTRLCARVIFYYQPCFLIHSLHTETITYCNTYPLHGLRRFELPYNEAFLREVMRKETLVPLSLLHRATEDTELGGYNIPKDTIMIVNLWSFHNDPDFWGDPEAFRPERFLDERGQLLKKDYSLPFSAGKRLCAGETFARQFIFLILSALLQNFTVKGAQGKPLPSTDPDLPGIIVTKKDMWIRFEPRS
ncbi:putative cytochrome P450 304a1 [Zootermopsis nevadensis]|uniref:Putative cytochrome P450 304a1 n=1 Tax=Zootermopsis nevadensis TaxID=136037 RepID=A0A067QSF4_ZOONE|nr:putative cytochrome P450 304a1 [Zootermopsis nevadensis]